MVGIIDYGMGNLLSVHSAFDYLGADVKYCHHPEDLKLKIVACNWMPLFMFADNNNQVSAELRTLMMQEMIKKGVLFQGAFTPCYSHTIEDVNYFSEAFYESLKVYKQGLTEGVDKYLVGHSIKPVFRKYI